MSNKKSKDDEFHLLIEKKLVSKPSKRYYLLFKPKSEEIVESEPYELSLLITNIGDKPFPGGFIKNLKILNYTTKTRQNINDIPISDISIGEPYKTKAIKLMAFNSGTTWISLEVKSSNDKQIKYYQLSKPENQVVPVNNQEWEYCFYVTSQQEIRHRYANNILLILTAITVIITTIILVINLIPFLR